MRKRVLIVAAVLAVAAVAVVLALSRRAGSAKELAVSGNIEVTQADVAFKISGRVVERAVDEGQLVKTGQLVAKLDDQDLTQQVALRGAEVDAARAALDELEAGSRAEDIAAAKAQVDQAEADVTRLTSDDTRDSDLYKKDVISAREYDATHSGYLAAQARLREAQERYSRVKNGPRKEDIEQGRARLDQARQAMALAQTQLGYATLASPMDGVVLSKNVEPGEFVAPGTPVVTVGDLEDVYLRAYVEEEDLGRVKVGQKAFVTTDTYPGRRYEGRVSFISPEAEFTPKSVQTKRERVRLVYRIKIDVPNPSMELKPGMPADAVVETGD